ncbi:MAG: permease [Elusimicrobia bacterium]|nr:MAG: permease [Elusimicrobiota bacterium]KAF0155883.1 MAG: permease [Elusimicrobiota bacterium]
MNWLHSFALEFLRLTWEVLPWFLAGAAFGAALDVWLKPEFALRHLRGGWLSMLKATALGMLMPGCACATMPMAEGLRRKGADLGTVTSFLLASPLASPQTLVLTWALLGWQFAAARALAGLAGGMAIGALFLNLEKRTAWLDIPAPAAERKIACGPGCDCPGGRESDEDAPEKFWPVFVEIIKELGKYFAIGMAIASALVVSVPQGFIAGYLGSSGPLAYLAAALAGVPLYVCEGEEIPLTLSFIKLGLGPGPAFTFLLGSVGTCIPTMIMSQRLIGRRGMLVYAAFWLLFALSAGLLFGSLF